MKTAVIYWSGTGNTEQMASAIAEGAGAELFTISEFNGCLLYTSPSPRDRTRSRMPSSA